MVRIVGTNLPDNKRLEYALTLIFGIGFTRSKTILTEVGIDVNKKVKDLVDTDIKKIQEYIEKNYRVEGDLRSQINDNIKRLKEISSYRGYRHIVGLPVRGQRTRSNARTRKGKKRTVGSLTKEAWAKMDQSSQQKKVKK
jgi:small subunit ribosomal protein S13